MLKIYRSYWGDYDATSQKLAQYDCFIMPSLGKKIITVSNANQGFATLKGSVQKLGSNYANASLCLFKKTTRELLWEIKPNKDGSYQFRNLATDMPCFIVAFDNNQQYNAVIQDNVIPK